MLSLRTGPAESSRGAPRLPGFGFSASAPGFQPRRLPSRLTSRSSRRRVVASLKLPGMRAILTHIRRVRRGLTPALGRRPTTVRCSMKKTMRTILLSVIALMVTAPLSIIVTVVLFPFWSWLESSSGIESVGHSGPADWCYLFIFVVLLTILAATLMLIIRSSHDQPSIQAK